jgi:hypothetical protein
MTPRSRPRRPRVRMAAASSVAPARVGGEATCTRTMTDGIAASAAALGGLFNGPSRGTRAPKRRRC